MHAFDMPRRAYGLRGAGGKQESTVPFAGTVSAHWLGWRYGVALASGATIVVIAGILMLDHNRPIALDHITGWPWLAEANARMLEALQDGTTSVFGMVKDLALRKRDTLQDKLDQVRTAAMARLV